jgi:uncharacterized protein YnzC (UPF0291/DUF896 family)
MENIYDRRPLTFADIFLNVLEKMNQNEEKKVYIRKIRILMNVPEFTKFMNCCLINAIGIKTPITESTVDKAIECLRHYYEDDVERNTHLSSEQKENQKDLNRNYMKFCLTTIKNFLESENLLIYQ